MNSVIIQHITAQLFKALENFDENIIRLDKRLLVSIYQTRTTNDDKKGLDSAVSMYMYTLKYVKYLKKAKNRQGSENLEGNLCQILSLRYNRL